MGPSCSRRVFIPEISFHAAGQADKDFPGLPEERPDVSLRQKDAVRGGQRLRILVAEDNEHLRYLFRKTLEAEGYGVIACPDGLRALEVCLLEGRIDLLLSDVQMPYVTGDQLALGCAKARPGVPIILMSGRELDPVVHAVIEATGCLFLEKPFAMEEMLSAVRRMTFHRGGDENILGRTA